MRYGKGDRSVGEGWITEGDTMMGECKHRERQKNESLRAREYLPHPFQFPISLIFMNALPPTFRFVAHAPASAETV
jgi:hypothetical protein